MFPKLLEKLIKRYLDPYVDGISNEGLSLLSGSLEFKNLRIKPGAFDFLRKSGIQLRTASGHQLVACPLAKGTLAT